MVWPKEIRPKFLLLVLFGMLHPLHLLNTEATEPNRSNLTPDSRDNQLLNLHINQHEETEIADDTVEQKLDEQASNSQLLLGKGQADIKKTPQNVSPGHFDDIKLYITHGKGNKATGKSVNDDKENKFIPYMKDDSQADLHETKMQNTEEFRNEGKRVGEDSYRNKSDKENDHMTDSTRATDNLKNRDDHTSDTRGSVGITGIGGYGATNLTAGPNEILERKNGSTKDSLKLLGEKYYSNENHNEINIWLDDEEDCVGSEVESNTSFGNTDKIGSKRFKHTRQKRQGATCLCPRCVAPVVDLAGRVDVAFQRPAETSTSYNEGSPEEIAGACGGVNGISGSQRLINEPNCFHTGEHDGRAFWLLDLQEHYTIDFLIVYMRDVGTFTNDKLRLRYTVVTVNGVLCYEYSDDEAVLNSFARRHVLVCKEPMRGRWVMFQKTSRGHTYDTNLIIYCEVMIYVCKAGLYLNKETMKCEACTEPCTYPCDNYFGCNIRVMYNVANRKPTDCSHREYGTCDSVVNGRTDNAGNYQECMATHTGMGPGGTWNPYWQVDLEGMFLVYSITVKNRLDCCGLAMSDFSIVVVKRSSEEIITDDYSGRKELCHHWTLDYRNGQTREFDCPNGLRLGRYVIIQAKETTSLYLCDVRVTGMPVDVKGIGYQGCQTRLKTIFCAEELLCENNVCKIHAGNSCRGHADHCRAGAVCESGTCRWDLNIGCDPEHDLCKTGTECDTTSSKVCKITPGEGGCTNSSQCSKTTQGNTCDFLSHCNKGSGQTCSKTEECVAGSECHLSSCQCGLGFDVTNTSICRPLCNTTGAQPCQNNAVCDAVSNTCKCDKGFDTIPKDFTCVPAKAAIQADCTSTAECQSRLICENKKCRLHLRGVCKEDEDCQSNSECEDSTCRHSAGADCKVTDDCQFNATCKNGKCKVKVGKDCSKSPNHCVMSTECSSKMGKTLCLKEPGTSCHGENMTMCMAGTVCDTDKYCKLEIGGPCRVSGPSMCQYPSQCQNGLCKLILGANCKGNEQHCAEGLVCDKLQECRVPKGKDCADLPDGCLAGAACSENKVCECSSENTASSSSKCDPNPGVAGGECSSQRPCTTLLTFCNRTTGRCVCGSDFGYYRPNYTCNFAPGTSCNHTRQCASEALCGHDRVCEIVPGGSCDGNYARHCASGSFCDQDKFCRLYENQNCKTRPTMCRLGYVCDLTFKCKIPAGQQCYNNQSCAAGSDCIDSLCACNEDVSRLSSNGTICVPADGRPKAKCQAGSKCEAEYATCNDQGICECKSGYLITRLNECKKGVGMGCEEDDECGDDLYCDDTKKCKFMLGVFCDQTEDQCGNGAVCDENNECRVDLQGDCSGIQFSQCKAGTFCDWLEKCRLDVGQLCNDTEDCPAGAECFNGTHCMCIDEIAVVANLICAPKIGRVGAECDAVDKACTVPGSVCIERKCSCGPGVEASRDFACPAKSVQRADISTETIGLVVGLCLALLLLLLGGVFLARRHLRSQKELGQIRQSRRDSMKQLANMEEAAEDKKPAELSPDQEETSVSEVSESQPETSLASDATMTEASEVSDAAESSVH